LEPLRVVHLDPASALGAENQKSEVDADRKEQVNGDSKSKQRDGWSLAS
jgi:hypothetical protein